MRTSISKKAQSKLEDQLTQCLFFTPYSRNSARVLDEGIVTFTSHFSTNESIPLSEDIHVNVIDMGSLFHKAIDLILEHSVDASMYAFREAPENYKKCLVFFAENVNIHVLDVDPALKQEVTHNSIFINRNKEAIEKEIASLISLDLEGLSIDCSEYIPSEKSYSSSERLNTLGTFNRFTNELKIYPLSTLLVAGSKLYGRKKSRYMLQTAIRQRKLLANADFIVALSLESMVHELSHLVFKCTTEHEIKNYLLDRDNSILAEEKGVSYNEARKIVREYTALGFGEGISNILLAHEKLDDLMSHALRFKLGLLYLLSIPSEVQLVREVFVPELLRRIHDSQILKFDFSSGEIEITTPFVKSEYIEKFRQEFPTLDEDVIHDIQYEWEYPISDMYQASLNWQEPRLVFRSEIVSTNDLEKTLGKRKRRSNYAKQSHTFLEEIDLSSEELLYAFEGNSNLLSIPFLEDPLDFMALLVHRQELMSSKDAKIGESAGLYLMFDLDDARLKLIYSPDAESFFEITTGEAWFILTL